MAYISRVMKYPPEILKVIDSLIDAGKDTNEIKYYLAKNCTSQIPKIPNVRAIQHYIEWRKSTLPQLSAIVKDETVLTPQKPYAEMDPAVLKDKKYVLEDLMQTCYSRLGAIQEKLSTGMDPRWESHLRGYVEEARHLVETLAKLSGELNEDNTVILNIVQSELTSVIKIFQDIVMEVCPGKIDIFKQKLEERLAATNWQVEEPSCIDVETVTEAEIKKEI